MLHIGNEAAMIPYYENKEEEIQVFHAGEMTFPPHLHGQLELLYFTDGSLEVTVNQSVYLLSKGDFIAIFPGSVHSYRMPDPACCGVLFAIVSPRLTGEFSGTLRKYHPENPVLRRAELHRDVGYAMKGMRQEPLPDRKAPDYAARLAVFSAYLQLILARTVPQFTLLRNTDSNYFDLTYRVVDYVSQNYNLPLSLDSIAKELGVSKYHLSRVFSNKLNTSFTGYLGSIRVGRAQSLLRSTDDSVTKIAFDCGFESQRTFNRIFHDLTGVSPSKFRSSN